MASVPAASERRALSRRLDTFTLMAVVAFVAAGGGFVALGVRLNEWWISAILYLVTSFLIIVALVGGGTQVFKTIEDAVQPEPAP
jgi:hypothetical protein